jgi:hypothetical protein
MMSATLVKIRTQMLHAKPRLKAIAHPITGARDYSFEAAGFGAESVL